MVGTYNSPQNAVWLCKLNQLPQQISLWLLTKVLATMLLLLLPISQPGMSSLAIQIRADAQSQAARFLPLEIVALTTWLVTSSCKSHTHGLSKWKRTTWWVILIFCVFSAPMMECQLKLINGLSLCTLCYVDLRLFNELIREIIYKAPCLWIVGKILNKLC